MEKVRAFIAVQLPPEVKQALSSIQSSIRSGCGTPVKWVEPKNLHLTLKFLGDTNIDAVESILEVIKKSTAGASTLHFELSGLGTFPGGQRVRVVWAGLCGDIKPLSAIQEGIETGLVPLGFKKEQRSFQPHLTIGRVRDQATPSEREDLFRRIEQHGGFRSVPFSVNAVFLIKSQLTPSSPVYTDLGQVSLLS